MKGAAKMAVATACAALASACILGAAAVPSTTFDARVSMDTVDIRVSGAPAGRTLIYDDELLPYVASLSNSGQDCYVRVRAYSETEEGASFELDSLEAGQDWLRAPDGWLYLKPVLADGQAQTIAFSVGNPSSPWDGNAMALDVHVVAQAIQASNFTPDYESPQPWGEAQAYTTEHFRESE